MIGRLIRRWKRRSEISGLLAISALLTLVGLALMVWSLIQPTPMPVILAMSVGQGLGSCALLLFGYAVLIDQLRTQRAKGAREASARGDATAGGDASMLHAAGHDGPSPAGAQAASRREALP